MNLSNLIDGKNDLHIIIAFGKNQDDMKKSLKESDLAYFKQFPNISIVYIPELHGKYYGNEKRAITTSINLYDYSFDNNSNFVVVNKLIFSKLHCQKKLHNLM